MQSGRLATILAIGLFSGAAALAALDPVDVNQATVAELMQVPGMTPVWAARIVRFRPYRTKLDLLEKGIVSADEYRRIKDNLVAHRPAK